MLPGERRVREYSSPAMASSGKGSKKAPRPWLSTSGAGKELPDRLRPGLSYGHRRSASAPRRISAWYFELRCHFSVPSRIPSTASWQKQHYDSLASRTVFATTQQYLDGMCAYLGRLLCCTVIFFAWYSRCMRWMHWHALTRACRAIMHHVALVLQTRAELENFETAQPTAAIGKLNLPQ